MVKKTTMDQPADNTILEKFKSKEPSKPETRQLSLKAESMRPSPSVLPVIAEKRQLPLEAKSVRPSPSIKPVSVQHNNRYRKINSSSDEEAGGPVNACPRCAHLEAELSEKLSKIDLLTRLNIELQEDVIKIHKDLGTKVMDNSTKDKTPDTELEVGQTVGDKVHLAFGVYIKKDVLNYCWIHNVSYSAFIKEMAVAIFGRETLMKSSVTGRASNRTKTPARPPLDSTNMRALHAIFEKYLKEKGLDDEKIQQELKKTKTYIAAKIADLNREPRKQAKDMVKVPQKETNEDNERKNTDSEDRSTSEDRSAGLMVDVEDNEKSSDSEHDLVEDDEALSDSGDSKE